MMSVKEEIFSATIMHSLFWVISRHGTTNNLFKKGLVFEEIFNDVGRKKSSHIKSDQRISFIQL